MRVFTHKIYWKKLNTLAEKEWREKYGFKNKNSHSWWYGNVCKQYKKIVEKNPRVEKIETASDGQEEIIKIMNFEPDLVFTDMQMPKRDGLDVIESIQSYPAVRKKPRFVLVTSDRDSRLVVKSRKLGFCIEYKPIKEETINKYIDEYEPIPIDEEAESK